MAKKSKKALGAAMAGVMAVGAVSGAVSAFNQVNVANAAESQSLKDAKAKINHLTWSVQNNYLGIKNQAQWEVYIKEARALIANMPKAEALQAKGLSSDLDKIAALVQAVARVNQVEKSMETNYHGIKNAQQWNEYLDLAAVDLVKVDEKVFGDEIAEIAERLNVCDEVVQKIEKEFKVEYDKVVASFEEVKKSKNLDDAKKVLAAAEALGTCDLSDKLEADIKAFIAEIDKSQYIINSVDALNSKKIDIKFNKEVSDAKSIAKDGDRIIIVKAGDSINDSSASKITSNIITFSSDNKVATAVLDKDLETGVRYTVHLVSPDKKSSIASITSVLVGGIESPGVSVTDGSDKIVLKYSEKMKDSAIETSNYKVFDSNGKEISSPFTKAEWVDKVEKKEVKFTVNPGALKAGEEYKIEVDSKNVKTDAGKDLSDNQKVVKVSTPSIESSRPVVKTAYVQDASTLVVKFDKKLNSVNPSKDLLDLKRADGKSIAIDSVTVNGSDSEVVIKVASKSFEDGENYRLTLQSNTVINNVYRNAGNSTVSSYNVSVPEAKAVTSVKAKFVSQSDKSKYNLVLEFDKPVKSLDASKVVVDKLGSSYRLSGLNTKIDANDSSNRTIVIENVQEKLGVQSSASYKISVEAGAVKTGSVQDITNKEILKDTITGIDNQAPTVDKVTLESADRITVKFDRSVNASGLSASDVKVKGFIKRIDNSVVEQTLTGSKLIKVSYSGDTVTITPADSSVKFATEYSDDLVTIAKETIKDSNGIVNDAEYTAKDAKNRVDNAAPEAIGARATASTGLEVTYTERVEFKSSDAKAANQFSVTGVEKAGEATSHSISRNVVTLTFAASTFDTSKDYSDAKVKYTSNVNYVLRDLQGNVAANATITGIYNGSYSNGGGSGESSSLEKAKIAANEAITKLDDYAKAGGVTEANKAEAQKAVDAAKTAVAAYEKEGGKTTDLTNFANIKVVEDAIKALELSQGQVVGTYQGAFGMVTVNLKANNISGVKEGSVTVNGTVTSKAAVSGDTLGVEVSSKSDVVKFTSTDGKEYTVVIK